MTKTQLAYTEALKDNLDLATQAGLLVKLEIEDHGFFISICVRVKHDPKAIKVRRMGHDNEIFAHLMVGKRGKLDGMVRVGSVFSDIRYTSDSTDKENRDVFQYLAKSKLASDIGYMVDFAEKHKDEMAA